MSGRRIEARTRGQQHSPGVTAFQLWLALPPELENGPAEGICVSPEAVPQLGNVRVLLGRHGDPRVLAQMYA